MLFKNEPKILTIQEIDDETLLKDFEKLKNNMDSIISKIYYPSFIKEFEKRGFSYKEVENG